MSVFTAKKLSFSYPTGTAALDDISFDIEEGSFVTVCGLSGCGKSTLLRLLKQGLQPRGKLSGELLYFGESLSELSMARSAQEIGIVMQNPDSQLVTDKVWHELAFSLESAGMPVDVIRRRVSEMACYFGLEELFERDCASLSGGQKQLVSLAAAAAIHPRVLLLDEPSSQLDPIAAQGFLDALSRLNRDFGMTIVIAEHRLEELLHISDRIMVMEHGRLIADCEPRYICSALSRSNPMMQAMPVSVQLYAAGGGQENAPLSIRDGSKNEICRGLVQQQTSKPTAADKKGDALITAKELWVSFGRLLPDVLKAASLTVYGGRIYAILGGNGSGKTTLLKCLAGAIRPLSGSVKPKKGITTAYLPQNPCELFTEETVREELSAAAKDYEQTAQDFALCKLYSSHPYDLSGGEQQRLALAKLMLKKPSVLLLDEPTKGMDTAAKANLCRLLRQLADSGTAIVLVTHDVQLAEDCADICGLLFNGEITSEAAPTEFFGGNYFYTTPLQRLRHAMGL